jgi:2',3'-cyclic-nucleotide 2'-phosphodiesterase (5'-nucleotidase family)
MKLNQQKNNAFTKIKKILDEKPEVIIVHVTDTYFIEETKVNQNIDLPGFARIYSLIKFIETQIMSKKINTSVLLLHGGDFLFPSLMSLYFKGKQMVEILNKCGFNFCTIGNHDFDGGAEIIKKRLNEAVFDVVCSNLISPKNEKKFQIHKYKFLKINKKQSKIAITGIAGIATMRKAHHNGFDILPPELSLKHVIETINEKHPRINHLIVLSHMSNDEDIGLKEWLNKNWNGYVYMLGGHDHNEIFEYNPITNPKSILLKGQSNCRTVQIVGINTRKVLKASQIKKMTKSVAVLDSDLTKIYPDEEIKRDVAKWEQLLEKRINEAESDRIIKKFKVNTVLDATELQLRRGSTNFGNFVADCMSEFTGSDIAFINSGHFRGDRKIGNNLKISDLRRIFVMDTNDALVKITMTSTECKEFLKHAYSVEGHGKILQVSKATIKILQKSIQDDTFSVTMLWDMLRTNDDGFTSILASNRKISLKKLQSKLKKHIITNSSLFDVIEKTAKHVRYDSSTRISVRNFSNQF